MLDVQRKIACKMDYMSFVWALLDITRIFAHVIAEIASFSSVKREGRTNRQTTI